MEDRVLSYYTELSWVGFHDLELYGSHATTNKEGVAFADGTICWNDQGSINIT
jgi:hypothetical protein